MCVCVYIRMDSGRGDGVYRSSASEATDVV